MKPTLSALLQVGPSLIAGFLIGAPVWPTVFRQEPLAPQAGVTIPVDYYKTYPDLPLPPDERPPSLLTLSRSYDLSMRDTFMIAGGNGADGNYYRLAVNPDGSVNCSIRIPKDTP